MMYSGSKHSIVKTYNTTVYYLGHKLPYCMYIISLELIKIIPWQKTKVLSFNLNVRNDIDFSPFIKSKQHPGDSIVSPNR